MIFDFSRVSNNESTAWVSKNFKLKAIKYYKKKIFYYYDRYNLVSPDEFQ